jgi:hypothetical protein
MGPVGVSPISAPSWRSSASRSIMIAFEWYSSQVRTQVLSPGRSRAWFGELMTGPPRHSAVNDDPTLGKLT